MYAWRRERGKIMNQFGLGEGGVLGRWTVKISERKTLAFVLTKRQMSKTSALLPLVVNIPKRYRLNCLIPQTVYSVSRVIH